MCRKGGGCTFEEVALGNEGEVGEPGVEAVKDVGGVHNGGPPHLALLPATPTHTNIHLLLPFWVDGATF